MPRKEPRLVYAFESDYEGPMCLNDDNTLGITNFTYSDTYTINGFDYVDEFFKAIDGITYARVLFKNNLETPQELSSQRHYYKFAEVIPYPPGIPGLFITATHESAAFNPWILQNWIIAQEIQDNINREQWRSIQIYMQQQYQTELAAEKSICRRDRSC